MILLWENLISATLALPLRKGCLFDSLSFGVLSHKGTIMLRSCFGVPSVTLRYPFGVVSEWYRARQGGIRDKNR